MPGCKGTPHGCPAMRDGGTLDHFSRWYHASLRAFLLSRATTPAAVVVAVTATSRRKDRSDRARDNAAAQDNLAALECTAAVTQSVKQTQSLSCTRLAAQTCLAAMHVHD